MDGITDGGKLVETGGVLIGGFGGPEQDGHSDAAIAGLQKLCEPIARPTDEAESGQKIAVAFPADPLGRLAGLGPVLPLRHHMPEDTVGEKPTVHDTG
jgi:hypothetical protein